MNLLALLSQVEGVDLDQYKLLLLIFGIVALILVLVYVALQSRYEEE